MKNFAIDRKEVPSFYTPKTADNSHNTPVGQVLVQSSDHTSFGWITVGYMSRETPLGQGTYLGFPRGELRLANREEVLASLKANHPLGKGFRPDSMTVADAQFHLILSQATRNWTTDEPSRHGSVIPVSRQELKDYAQDEAKKHRRIIANWDRITAKQRWAIKQALEVKTARRTFKTLNYLFSALIVMLIAGLLEETGVSTWLRSSTEGWILLLGLGLLLFVLVPIGLHFLGLRLWLVEE